MESAGSSEPIFAALLEGTANGSAPLTGVRGGVRPEVLEEAKYERDPQRLIAGYGAPCIFGHVLLKHPPRDVRVVHSDVPVHLRVSA